MDRVLLPLAVWALLVPSLPWTAADAAPGPAAAGLAQLPEALRQALAAGGSLQVTTWGPGGPVVLEVPAEPARLALGPSLLGCKFVVWCGPDIGTSEGLPSPFCDGISGWVAHTGAPGDAYVVLRPVAPSAEVVCGGFFGPAYTWEVAALAPVAAATQLSGCYAKDWALHAGSYCPRNVEDQAFLLHWRFRGVGVAASFGGPGSAFDYFLGLRGMACIDLPPGATLPTLTTTPCP